MRIKQPVSLSRLLADKTEELFTGGWNIHEFTQRLERESIEQFNISRKWIEFLNQSFHKPANCAYQSLMEGLLDLLDNSEVIMSQSEHELAISFEILESVFRHKEMLVIRESWISRKLIMFSVIVSKYPGMVIRPLREGFQKLLEQPSIYSIDQLFDHTFTKYQTPSYLNRHFEYLNLEELLGLMRINQGVSPNEIEVFKKGLTKREAHQLIYAIHNAFRYDNDIILRGKIITKLYDPKHEIGLRDYLNRSHTFNSSPKEFYQRLDYWGKGFKLVNELIQNNPTHHIDYDGFMDFLEAMSKIEGFSLDGRTPESFRRMSDDWHREVYLEEKLDYSWMKWPGMGLPKMEYSINNETFLFEELKTGRMLYSEGMELEHCVYHYAPRCELGYTHIWSLKKRIDNEFRPRITIEIQNKRIVQARGKRNRKPYKNELDVIEKWAKDFQLINGRY